MERETGGVEIAGGAVNRTGDALIVGAGVIGASVAFELSKRGMRVIVVDRGAGPGFGSTSASSAVMRYHYSTIDGVASAWEATQIWLDWAQNLGGRVDSDQDGPLVQAGVVMLDAPIIDRARTTSLFQQAGVPFEYWEPGTLRDRVPGIDVGRHWPPKRIDDDDFWQDTTAELGALYTPDGGYIRDPMFAAQELAEAARRHGAEFEYRQEVASIRQSGGQVSGCTLADGTEIDVPIIVNCAGPWSGQINDLAGVGSDFTVSVRPLRQEVHYVDAPDGYSSEAGITPVISDSDLGTYIRSTPGGGMLVGGAEPECDPLEWLEDPDDYNPNCTNAAFETQIARAARRFPELDIPRRPKGVVGIYDVTPDWTPIYDRTDLDGFYVAIGTSGNQFKNAPLVGQFMASLIDAVSSGLDHDIQPHSFVGTYTGLRINLGAFSRRREQNPYSTGTVLG